MKVFKWFVETIVYKEDTSLEMFGFEVETLNDSKQTVFEIAKYRTNARHEKVSLSIDIN